MAWETGSIELHQGTAVAIADAKTITFSSRAGAHVVLFQGRPLRQTFVQRGPYAMGTTAELDAVEAAYREGRLGSLHDEPAQERRRP